MRIYLDHNILDALIKNTMTFPDSNDTVWIYSFENFNEIKRSQNMQFLDVLANLDARMLELELNKDFKLTGRAFLHEYQDPHELYAQWLERTSEVPIEDGIHLYIHFLARLAGADNHTEILQHPNNLRKFLYSILSPHDFITSELDSQIEQAVSDIQLVTGGVLQDVKNLENSRASIGIGKGVVNNFPINDNPLLLIWEIMRDKAPGMTIDQFYGFDPIEKQGYDNWPCFLGIVGCHTVLNFLGFHPDKGLSIIKKIPGIMSDANHTAMAIYCDAIMSRDQRFCAKARAIYDYLELDIKILNDAPNF